MPLFGSANDARLINSISREVMHKYHSVEVEIFKLSLRDTEINLYGESSNKYYFSPVRAFALVTKDEILSEETDIGMDFNQTVQFAFLRDDLECSNLVIDEGDIVKFDERFYEVDNTKTIQYWAGRNNNTFLFSTEGRDKNFGLNVSVVAQTHLTRLSQLDIIDVRSGNNDNVNNFQPKNN